jgi:peptidoglycan/LPS O-acetylase OafA/YrhL
MGYYRLLLSMLVLASHVYYKGWQYGESAVICFLLISGFVMAKLIDAHYSDSGKTPLFYVDRAARIFPQYLFYCAATLVLMFAVDLHNPWTSACTTGTIAGNLFLYQLYDSNGAPIYLCTLIPPAWSLSLEWAFYLIIPFLINARSKAIFLCVAAYSVSVYIKAYLGIIDTEWFGYRHLSGTLFIFLVGVAFARDGAFWRLYRWGMWTGSLVLLVFMLANRRLYELHTNFEILFGIVAGIPALSLAIRVRQGRLGELAGDLSYGVFLNHFFLILILNRFTNWTAVDVPLRLIALACASLALSALTFTFIETPVMRWRRRLRSERESRVGAALHGVRRSTRAPGDPKITLPVQP